MPVSSAGVIVTGTVVITAVTTMLGDNQSSCCCGKVPPIDEFTGEDSQVPFDDWLPIFERAATRNGWTQDELTMQLAGYLRGRAL